MTEKMNISSVPPPLCVIKKALDSTKLSEQMMEKGVLSCVNAFFPTISLSLIIKEDKWVYIIKLFHFSISSAIYKTASLFYISNLKILISFFCRYYCEQAASIHYLLTQRLIFLATSC